MSRENSGNRESFVLGEIMRTQMDMRTEECRMTEIYIYIAYMNVEKFDMVCQKADVP
jgi:hypothetical protein